MALWDGLHTVADQVYHRTFTERYNYDTANGQDNARYIFKWFFSRQTGVQYEPLCGMMGCFNGESRLNPAAVLGFHDCAWLLQNRSKAFGVCQFVPGCLPLTHDANYWQNYHGSGKPIFYYWLANHLRDDLNYLYNENDAPCSDMDAQLEYIYNQNGWKKVTDGDKYSPITGRSYRGSFSDFLTSTDYTPSEYAEWFVGAFVRPGGPSVAVPRYANFANSIYTAFYSEFGGGDPPPTPPTPPVPPPPPVPIFKKSNFIITAKAAGLF